ncbi:MAG: hypothetical protein V4526_01455 [Patescibacteria group bacterium]
MEEPTLLVPSVDLIGYLARLITFLFSNYTETYPWIAKTIAVFITISIPLSIIFMIGIITAVERLKKIRQLEKELYDAKVVPAYTEETPQGDPELTNRWRNVLVHIDSENPNDWKQAIIDADSMLDVMLTSVGFLGDGVGEKLKRAREQGAFATIDNAWEAHLVRNRIAHDGSDFVIDKREARRIIMLYKDVFHEFYYI